MITGLPTFPELWAARVGALLRPATIREYRIPDAPEHPVIRALRSAGKPLTNGQLAQAIGRSQGQTTKIRQKLRPRLIEWRQGKYVFVTLADFSDLPMVSAGQLSGKWRQS